MILSWFAGTIEVLGGNSIKNLLDLNSFVHGFSRSGHLEFTYIRVLFPFPANENAKSSVQFSCVELLPIFLNIFCQN